MEAEMDMLKREQKGKWKYRKRKEKAGVEGKRRWGRRMDMKILKEKGEGMERVEIEEIIYAEDKIK